MKTRFSDSAIESLINASRALREGRDSDAEAHFQDADNHNKMHIDYLKSVNQHTEAGFADKMYQQQKQIMREAHKISIPDVKQPEKKETKKSMVSHDVRQVEKGIFLKAEKVQRLGQSGNPRYQYKGLHELHPEDRKRVLGRSGNQPMYPGADHHKFVYPTDSEGRLVFSARLAAPAHHDFSAAKASMEESDSGIKFKQGQGVRIDDPSHELHGSLGLVQLPHPSFPDKVQVMFAGGRREFLDQSKIKPSSQGVQKAVSTVIDIKSRLKKPKA
jgi:hypothetical protein